MFENIIYFLYLTDSNQDVKGQVSREFDVISKPKNVSLSDRNIKLLPSFVINYHPSAIKLSISASG